MKNTKTALNPHGLVLTAAAESMFLPPPRLMVFLALFLMVGMADWATAAGAPSSRAEAAQGQTTYIDEAEENAYRTAKKEPDPQKRAMKIYEFYQKYPKSLLMDPSDFELIRPIEAQYNDYYSASQESDPVKRGELLIEFLQKYPQSPFKENAERDFSATLRDAYNNKQYEKAESLAEKWLKVHPDNKEALAILAESSMNLKHYEKYAESLEALYAIQPTPSMAREIADSYLKAQNIPKEQEWTEKLLKMPEFAADYMLRYDYVKNYLSKKDLPKAAEYAQLTLKSADLVEKPDAKAEEQLRQIRRSCHHVIASNLMDKDSFEAAIEEFKKAIAIVKYDEGYYLIGQCFENLQRVEDAMLYYAKTVLMNGESAGKAKARLELLYKALHNDTLIGIDKIYNKAKEAAPEPDSVRLLR